MSGWRAVGLVLAGSLAAGTALADMDVASLAPYENRPVTEIKLAGCKVTREYVVTRELQTRIGEPLHAATVVADLQRLENLSIFAEIGVEAEADGDGARLLFRFKEMPSWIPLPAFAYTEEDGFSAGPKLSALNLTGRDIAVTARAFFGGKTEYSANVSWPWIGGNHVSLDFRGAYLERADKLNEFEETSYEFTPVVGTYLGEHGRLAGKFSLFRMHSDVDGKTLSPDNEDSLPRLGASMGWDTRDSWSNPRNGWQNEIEVWHTGGFLGGDAHFWSMNLDLRRWIPTANRQRLSLFTLLSLQSGTVNKDLPVYFTYRLGGANTIRGYKIDELGRELYGKNQFLGTAEYSFNLLPLRRWNIFKFALRLGLDFALFTDVGTAWSTQDEFSRWRAGVGGGFRLLVPGIEMVRLDVGWSEAGGFQFHFASGNKAASQRLRLR